MSTYRTSEQLCALAIYGVCYSQRFTEYVTARDFITGPCSGNNWRVREFSLPVSSPPRRYCNVLITATYALELPVGVTARQKNKPTVPSPYFERHGI